MSTGLNAEGSRGEASVSASASSASARSGIFPEGEHLSPETQALFDEVFGPGSATRHAQRYAWQYRRALELSEAPRLELFWHQGRVVGSLGWLPDLLSVNGVPTPVRFTADLASALAYRNRGVGARLMQRFLSEPLPDGRKALPLALAVSPDARTLLLRLGFEEVPLTVHFRVLSLEGLAQRKEPILMRDGRLALPTRQLLRLADALEPRLEPWLGALTAAREALPASTLPASTLPASTLPASTLPASTLPASTLPASTLPAPLHFLTGVLWPELRQLPRRLTAAQHVMIREVIEPSSAVDGLTQRLSSVWPVAFLPGRSRLHWRYRQHPGHSYRMLEATREGSLTGFACWRIFQEPDGLRMAHLMQLLAAPEDDGTWDALLRAGLNLLRRERVFAVKAVSACPVLSHWLARYAFLPYGESPGLYCHTADSECREALRQPWLVGLGASDADV